MGGSFIKIEGLEKTLARFDVKKYEPQIQQAFTKFGENAAESAKQLAPVDQSFLKPLIFYKADKQKHKNPKISKDIIGFDLTINWNEPIILCEGAFDAIAIKRNAIPLFGKIIQPALQKKIIEKRVRDIYICLDADALKNAIQIAERFMAEGLNVYFVELQDADASELGFERIRAILNETDILTFEGIMHLKMGMLWT